MRQCDGEGVGKEASRTGGNKYPEPLLDPVATQGLPRNHMALL